MNEINAGLYEKLSRLEWLLHRQHLRSHAEYGPMGDPIRGQGRVLAVLKMKPEISARELSYLLAIRQQSLNELLNKLEKADYIIRTPSGADRRVMMIQLTEKGKTEQPLDQDFGGIFGCLNDGEQASFGEYLDRIITALEEQLGDGPDLYGPPPPPFGPPPPPPPHGPPHGPGPHNPGRHDHGTHGRHPQGPYPYEASEPDLHDPRPDEPGNGDYE